MQFFTDTKYGKKEKCLRRKILTAYCISLDSHLEKKDTLQ